MTFSNPTYLLLLIPALGWAIWMSLQMRGMPISRRRTALALRIVLLTLLILALAGLQFVRPNKGVATVFVLDRSASISTTQETSAERFIAKALDALGRNDSAGLVVFGKDPLIDTQTGSLRVPGRIYSAPDPSATDIAAAIRLATATMPEGSAKRIVLLTDGNETNGDAEEAAQAAAADAVQIDVAPIGPTGAKRGEVLVERVDIPSEVTRGQPFEIHVVAQSTGQASGIMHIDRDGSPVVSTQISLMPGVNDLTIGQTAGAPGFYRYRATLDVDNDTDPRNNTGMAYLSVRGRPRILLIEGARGSAAALEAALKPHDLDITRASIEGLPTRPDQLQAYDSLILSDFPAEGLTQSQMTMIAAAVRDSGMGFGMIGGENSFLPGGYYETPIADVLAVDMNIRQRKVFPSTCIEIVVDASGSMSMIEDGVPKIKIAASAAASMVRMMSPRDLVGVAGSTDAIEFVAPIQRATDKDAIAAQCGRLDAGGGGIYIEPSLEFADKTLTPVNTKVRHLILLSDGDDAEDQPGSFELAQRMVAKGMTISTIAVGDGKDVGFLKTLAAIGKGYFYLAGKANMLQRFITEDSSLMARSAIEEGAFLPKVDPADEVLRGLDLQSMPALYAYDLTSDRPMARTPMRTGKDDPLLAFWQYGLGTSMAFTSDAQPKWARHWVTWSDFDAFWAQAVRETLRQSSADRIRMSAHCVSGRGQLDIAAFDPDGNPINGLDAKINVTGPDGALQSAPIAQTGPGQYTGSFDAGKTGGYIISAVQKAFGSTKPLVTRAGYAVAYPPEYQAIGINTALLAQIASLTHGRILDRPVQAFRPVDRPGESVQDLWPTLLLAAALLFVLDIAVRRLAISGQEIAAWAIGALGATAPMLHHGLGATRPHSSRQGQTIASLNRARQQVRIPPGSKPTQPAPEQETSDTNIQTEARSDAGSRPRSKALETSQRLLQIKREKGEESRRPPQP